MPARFRRPEVEPVNPTNLSAAQRIALARVGGGRRPVPTPPPRIRAPVVAAEVAPSITPTDRARRAIELALRHVSPAELSVILNEVLPSNTSAPVAK